jgi:CubicO group peptidase (beta-lactamase class C family)
VTVALLAASSAGLAQTVDPATVGFSAQALAQIDTVLQQHIDAGDIAGGVVLVQRKGKIAFWDARGVADAKLQSPLKRDTVIWAASMSKPIVAASLLMLVDAGKVSIDDPVGKYLKDFNQPRRVRTLKPGSPPPPSDFGPPDPNAPKPQYDYVPAERAITVKDLLTHTSGIQVIGVSNDSIPPMESAATVGEWVAKLSDSVLEFQPGSKWAYSNAAGFDVLVRIVEVVSGQPFNQYVQQHLFDPLHMSSSGFHGQRPDLSDRLEPMDARLLANPCVAGVTFFCGSAGLWVPADDYAKFAQMLLNGGTAPDGRRVLKAASVKAMATSQIGDLFPGTQGISGQGAGMGLSVLVITDHKAAGVALPNGSFGWDGVGTRRFWVVPSEQMVIVMDMASAGAGGGARVPQVHRDVEAAAMAALKH